MKGSNGIHLSSVERSRFPARNIWRWKAASGKRLICTARRRMYSGIRIWPQRQERISIPRPCRAWLDMRTIRWRWTSTSIRRKKTSQGRGRWWMNCLAIMQRLGKYAIKKEGLDAFGRAQTLWFLQLLLGKLRLIQEDFGRKSQMYKRKSPDFLGKSRLFSWWCLLDSNQWPHRCERCALPTEPKHRERKVL